MFVNQIFTFELVLYLKQHYLIKENFGNMLLYEEEFQ